MQPRWRSMINGRQITLVISASSVTSSSITRKITHCFIHILCMIIIMSKELLLHSRRILPTNWCVLLQIFRKKCSSQHLGRKFWHDFYLFFSFLQVVRMEGNYWNRKGTQHFFSGFLVLENDHEIMDVIEECIDSIWNLIWNFILNPLADMTA